jgi:glycine betaine/proline transport system ATP-binding protein
VADPLIRVSNLYKVFGSDPKSIMAMVREGRPKDEIRSETGHALALKGVDLEIETSEIFVIMGLSGSGKSTLIRHLNRLIEPTEGSIHVGGVDLMSLSQTKLETFRQHRISMVFQRFALLPHRTALQNVAFGLAVQKQLKKVREKKAREWLEAVGLDGYEECYPAELSGGEQQRVGLARALCTDPDILLMDEAFSSLDPLIRSEMQGQLIDLQSRLKKTIVFITHDLNEAIRLGDRIAILKEGEISQVGKPQDILDNPADDYVAAFVRDVKRSRSPKARQ